MWEHSANQHFMPVILLPWETLANWVNVGHQLISAAIMLNDLLRCCDSIQRGSQKKFIKLLLIYSGVFTPRHSPVIMVVKETMWYVIMSWEFEEIFETFNLKIIWERSLRHKTLFYFTYEKEITTLCASYGYNIESY